LLKPVESRSIDLAIQSGRSPAIGGEESKKSSQRTDIVLETCPVQAFASFGDVRFDIDGLNASQCGPLFFQMPEKTLGGIPVVGNRGRSESAYIAQVIRVLFTNRGAESCCPLAGISDKGLGK
jgi:hypothetical protein